jgi:hypothetical protein
MCQFTEPVHKPKNQKLIYKLTILWLTYLLKKGAYITCYSETVTIIPPKTPYPWSLTKPWNDKFSPYYKTNYHKGD